MAISGAAITKELIDILDLPDEVIEFELNAGGIDDIVVCTCKYYPNIKLSKLAKAMQMYEQAKEEGLDVPEPPPVAQKPVGPKPVGPANIEVVGITPAVKSFISSLYEKMFGLKKQDDGYGKEL